MLKYLKEGESDFWHPFLRECFSIVRMNLEQTIAEEREGEVEKKGERKEGSVDKEEKPKLD